MPGSTRERDLQDSFARMLPELLRFSSSSRLIDLIPEETRLIHRPTAAEEAGVAGHGGGAGPVVPAARGARAAYAARAAREAGPAPPAVQAPPVGPPASIWTGWTDAAPCGGAFDDEAVEDDGDVDLAEMGL